MSNRLSSFIPLAPEITQANIASQFPRDTIKVPLPEMTHSQKLEKAEFDAKERKELAKKKEAMPDGRFPIRNEKDLKNAIHDVGRSNNPAAAKAWIKKRAKDLDCEDCLPGSWEKATEDELNMFNDELEKGGVGSGPGKYKRYEGLNRKKESHAEIINAKNKRLANDKKRKTYPGKDKNDSENNNVTKDMDGPGAGDEVEESVNKAFDNILGIEPDPIEKAFEDLIGIETDPVEKAFGNLLKKGEGERGGKIIGHTKSGKPVYAHKQAHHIDHTNWSVQDHHDASRIHNFKAQEHNEKRLDKKTSEEGKKIQSQHYEIHRFRAKAHEEAAKEKMKD